MRPPDPADEVKDPEAALRFVTPEISADLGFVLTKSSLPPVIGLPTPGVFSIPVKDIAGIEKLMKAALIRESGLNQLKNFTVDWSPASMQCLKVESEMDPGIQMGVCTVGAGAFELEAKVAVVKKNEGYSVSVIYANVD